MANGEGSGDKSQKSRTTDCGTTSTFNLEGKITAVPSSRSSDASTDARRKSCTIEARTRELRLQHRWPSRMQLGCELTLSACFASLPSAITKLKFNHTSFYGTTGRVGVRAMPPKRTASSADASSWRRLRCLHHLGLAIQAALIAARDRVSRHPGPVRASMSEKLQPENQC
jgi:hypothetical protein